MLLHSSQTSLLTETQPKLSALLSKFPWPSQANSDISANFIVAQCPCLWWLYDLISENKSHVQVSTNQSLKSSTSNPKPMLSHHSFVPHSLWRHLLCPLGSKPPSHLWLTIPLLPSLHLISQEITLILPSNCFCILFFWFMISLD